MSCGYYLIRPVKLNTQIVYFKACKIMFAIHFVFTGFDVAASVSQQSPANISVSRSSSQKQRRRGPGIY